jgi:hypothetical protein
MALFDTNIINKFSNDLNSLYFFLNQRKRTPPIYIQSEVFFENYSYLENTAKEIIDNKLIQSHKYFCVITDHDYFYNMETSMKNFLDIVINIILSTKLTEYHSMEMNIQKEINKCFTKSNLEINLIPWIWNEKTYTLYFKILDKDQHFIDTNSKENINIQIDLNVKLFNKLYEKIKRTN